MRRLPPHSRLSVSVFLRWPLEHPRGQLSYSCGLASHRFGLASAQGERPSLLRAQKTAFRRCAGAAEQVSQRRHRGPCAGPAKLQTACCAVTGWHSLRCARGQCLQPSRAPGVASIRSLPASSQIQGRKATPHMKTWLPVMNGAFSQSLSPGGRGIGVVGCADFHGNPSTCVMTSARNFAYSHRSQCLACSDCPSRDLLAFWAKGVKRACSTAFPGKVIDTTAFMSGVEA